MKKYLVVTDFGYYPDDELNNIRFHSDSFEKATKVSEFFKSQRRFDYSKVIDRDTSI